MDKIKKNYLILIGALTVVIFILIFRAYELAFHSPVPLSMLPQKPLIKRGTIYDSEGHELAISRGTVSIGIKPEGIVNAEITATLLASFLDMRKAEIFEKIKKSEAYFYLKKNVSLSEVRELQALRLSGVVFEEKVSRFYPNNNLASTLLGFTDVDNVGLSGIEYEYNDYLISTNNNQFIGNDVYLTINGYIQHQLEKALEAGRLKSGSKAAIGIVTDVHSGRILAMSSLPDFNPNEPTEFTEDSKRNRAIAENIEPGSTFKIFILAALLKDNMLNEKRTFFCPGYFEYKHHRLNCSSIHHTQTLTDAIKNSCNTAMIEASWTMPVMKLYEHLKQFGFTTTTHINLPGEENGFMPAPEKWDISLKMSIPIGQGLSVTPIQLVSAANSIANGGSMLRPLIVNKVTSPDGNIVQEYAPETRYMAISPAISTKILSYLQHVVTKGGTGYLASIPDFPIAGKTSTAMKSDKKGYTKGKYQASFIGFFPGDKPEISIFIWYDEPQGAVYQGGQVAAPIFKDVLKEIIPIVHMGKTKETQNLPEKKTRITSYNKNIMPNLYKKSKKEALFLIWSLFPGEHEIEGKGYLIYQAPPPGTRLKEPYKFTLKFSEKP